MKSLLRSLPALSYLCLACISAVSLAEDTPTQSSAPPQPLCGHWAAFRCCQVLGVPLEMEDVIGLLPPTDRGHSMKDLLEFFSLVGLGADARLETFEELITGRLPAVAHMNPDHFLVVVGADDEHVFLFDGQGRRQVWTLKDFRERWTRRTLTVWRQNDTRPLPAFLPRPTHAAPRIQFDTLLIDKGEIPSTGEPVEFVFPFRNLGTADLIIERVRAGCPCMESEKPKQAVPPGGAGEIRLKYSVEKGKGSFVHLAYVATNDPRFPLMKLAACGNATKTVRVEPKYLDLGRLVAGATYTTYCHLTYSGDVPLDVAEVELVARGLKGDWRILERELAEGLVPAAPGTVALVGNNACILALSLMPEPDFVGDVEGALYVHTSVEGFQTLRVPLMCRVVAPVLLLPEVLFLGEIRSGQSVQKTITTVSMTRDPFRIVGVDTATTGLNCSFPTAETHEAAISFTGRIEDPSRVANASIVLHVEMSGQPQAMAIDIPVFGLANGGLVK